MSELRAAIEAYKAACREFDSELERVAQTATKEELIAFMATEPKRPPMLQAIVDELDAA